MRTISADADAILKGGARKAQVRLSVKDSGGTYRDLTTYPGWNFLKSVTWKESVDDNGISWSAELVRELNSISLAPLLTASPLNRVWNPATAYAPLLQVNREVKIEWALQAEDDPTAPSWQLGVHGYIDIIDWGGGETVKLTGRGLEAKLVKLYVERERIYAFAQGGNATKGCYKWPDASSGLTRTFAVGDRMLPTDGKLNGHFYRASAITTGIVDATEPVWPTGSGATVVDGGVTWTESGATSNSAGTAVETVIQQYLDDNNTGFTLWCPASPGWAVKWFMIGRQPSFDELRGLADQIGWCIRPVYDSGSSDFRLKLYDPNRANTTSNRTFTRSETYDLERATIDVTAIRNVVRVGFNDSQDLDLSGNPKRKFVEVSDATSITKYDRQFCEVDEAHTSNIDTTAEATALANAILADLKEPVADFVAPLAFFPYCELADLYTLQDNGVHFDSDQKLAVVSYEHSFADGAPATTKLSLRGTPASGGKSTWHSRMTDSQHGEVHAATVQDTGLVTGVALVQTVGGATGVISWGGSKESRYSSFEIHASKNSGFTPDASTLKSVAYGRTVNLGDLDPTSPAYLKLIPVTTNGARIIRGQPSEQVSFNPGFVEPVHINPETVRGPTPPNGGFEGWFNGSSSPPDQWEMAVGTWGREIARSAAGAGNSRSGLYAIAFTADTTTAGKLRSRYFPVNTGNAYALSAWVKLTSAGEAGDNLVVAIEWYGYDKALLSTDSFTTDLHSLAAGWNNLVRNYIAPATSVYAKTYVAKAASTPAFTANIDDVLVSPGIEPWHAVGGTGEPAFLNGWVNFGGAYTPARFRRSIDGWVDIEGLVKSGTVGSGILLLPVGYRPETNCNVYSPQVNNNAFGVVEFQSGGSVLHQVGGSNVHLSLQARFLAAN